MPTQVVYTTRADAIRRHEQGVVSTSKKATLTGGGRAWSEDEEAYLVQTRLQKMPYKHIAAHLKKTELACRLHYHQLSHGGNRRKRTLSISSGSDHSPELPASMTDPMLHDRQSVSLPPPRRTESYGPASSSSGSDLQLPSIMGSSNNNNSSSMSMSPRLPAILPKPVSTPTPSQPGGGGGFAFRYPSIMHDEQQPGHLPRVSFHHHHRHQGPRYQLTTTPPPRLERSPLPLPSMSAHAPPPHVDLSRLQAIYDGHRDAFWSAVAKDYGANASPGVLETAWRTGVCGGRPITPAATPEAEMRRNRGYGMAAVQDKTRIASILAADEDVRGRR